MSFNILRFNEIDSTNAYALSHLEALSDRQIIVADKQNKGYGRFKRHWVSHRSDNIYSSIVLKPDLRFVNKHTLSLISMHMSLVICDILETYHVNAQIKWPNDVLVNNAKIAGLLSESSFRGNDFKGMVIGAGINLNMDSADIEKIDQPATALNLIIKKSVDRELFLTALLDHFFERYDDLLKKGFDAIKTSYMQRSQYIGKQISVRTQDNHYSGIARGFTDEGCLVLALDNNEEMTFIAGEIMI